MAEPARQDSKLELPTYDWFAYYSEKRIVHQWTQVMLLEGLPVASVLEIGPGLGVSTALLATAGYRVTTLDIEPLRLLGAVDHIVADLNDVAADRLAGHDCIVCCEVLEHFPFETSCDLLRRFAASGTRYLVIAVPYQGIQATFSLYLNLFDARKSTSVKLRNWFRRFPSGPPGDHQWECGWRGFPLAKLESAVGESGWRILKRTFTAGTRSVFFLAENVAAG